MARLSGSERRDGRKNARAAAVLPIKVESRRTCGSLKETYISAEIVDQLARMFAQTQVHRPLRIGRYEDGTELTYAVRGVWPSRPANVRLKIERFVGGGFAGQVYRVRALEIDAPEGPVEGLSVGGDYAMKILLPPSDGARRFRDAIYAVGFQAPFGLQCNPDAARAGALWQKFIRRGAAICFGDERAVVDILATFVDSTLGSCGELSEWVEGRVWRFEVNDHLTARRQWRLDRPICAAAGSPEYCAKRKFMSEFVDLLREMGAPEFARQYEWWTCKSQPNALKRRDTESDPLKGLTAVDFRAGLALLPFLPMSPGDVPLIVRGLSRGSLVQFDRCDLGKLRRFVDANAEGFADLRPALDELAVAERGYRDGQIDITHNHVRLLYSPRLWGGIRWATVTGWRVRNITDDDATTCLQRSRILTGLFWLLGKLPGLAILAAIVLGVWAIAAWRCPAWFWPSVLGLLFVAPPVLRVLHRMAGRADLRRHYIAILTSGGYFLRALRARCAEQAICWFRAGRLSETNALRVAGSLWRYALHLPLSVLPRFLHRVLTDRHYAVDLARNIFVRPIRLYFNAEAREQWLRDMVQEGRRKHMLTDEDAQDILERIKEPFIQKYLKSLAVHVCTLPVSEVVTLAVMVWYYFAHPELSQTQRTAAVAGIFAVFQVLPISPGSMIRGLYVLYLILRERNFKDYSIALFLGFFKIVGYLAFPIQMAYRYPTLARFMAAHWATEAVHVVPVFGEHGALLEHGVFDLFYNYPLTVRRRLREKAAARARLRPRIWHVPAIVLATVGVFCAIDYGWIEAAGRAPGLKKIAWLAILLPALGGAAATIFSGRAGVHRRMIFAILCGLISAVAYTAAHGGLLLYAVYARGLLPGSSWWEVFLAGLLWRVFAFTLSAVLGAVLAELFWPGLRKSHSA